MAESTANAFLFLDEVESTNSFLMQNPVLLAMDGLMLRAGKQTGGRGRRGRVWASGLDGQLYCSKIIHPEPFGIPFPSFTLLAGLACMRALHSFGLQEAQLKWPNDLLVKGKKIAGILTELKKIAGKPALVVGLGMNLVGHAEDYPDEVQAVVTTLELETTKQISAHQMMMEFSNQLNLILEQLKAGGFPTLLQEWEEQSGAVGKRIRFEKEEQECFGLVEGLNAEGHLIVKDEVTGKLETIYSGEVFAAS